VKEKDPTSDSTPPQLVSIQFTPPQVRDGEEIGLTVGATDDLSGVRNISGSIVSPTGGLLGFALTRDPADPNRYGARVLIPREAPEGVWRINYLHMTDNASNPVVLSYNQGGIPPGGTFTVVSSRPDSSPPLLRAIWLDRRAMKAGERNTVFVQAEDDRSGVALVSGVFHSPSRLARVGFGCRNSGTQWECDFLPPLSVDCGDWQLEQIQLQDKANNTTAMRGDNPLVASVKLNILSDQCDSEPPALLALVLDTSAVSNVQETVVTLTATVADDLSGVASVSGHMAGPSESGNAPRLFFSMSPAGDPETWVGRITVPKNAAKGIWAAGSIQMLDKANNLKIYTRGDAKLAPVQFRVE
ncbi:MAG TPA: hypothetical protein VNL91_05925, partial [Thermoanaerobaculia bacterium]|nr:hypothetical protein [Thermoanaerobaculia bacterium]